MEWSGGTQPRLAFERVTRRFPRRGRSGLITAVQDVSPDAADGEVVAVIGTSGCGKATLLGMAAGLDRPTVGIVRVDGDVIDGPNSHVAIMLQRDLLPPWRSIRQNVEFGLEIRGMARAAPGGRARELLAQMGLAEFADVFPHQVSGGMRERAAIARSLAGDPDLLLLDEPFPALDAQTKLVLRADLAKTLARAGKTALLITHDLEEALALSDRVLVMSARPGRITTEIVVEMPDRDQPLARRPHPRTAGYAEQLMSLLHIGTHRGDEGMTARRTFLAATAAALAMPRVLRAQQLTPIRYLLPAPRFLTAFGPHNLAGIRGYFTAAGAAVEFVSVTGGAQVATQMGAVNAPLGGGTGDTAIIVRPNGVPLRGVPLLGGGTLARVAARPDSNFRALRDLRGRRISVSSFQGSAYFPLLGAMGSVGLGQRDADIQAHGPAGVWQIFAQGEVEAMSTVPDWIVDARFSGVEPVILSTERDCPSMAQSVIVSDRAIRENAAPIRGVLTALKCALADIIADPDTTARELLAFNQSRGFPVTPDRVVPSIRLHAGTVYAGQPRHGLFDADRLARVQRFSLDAGAIRRETPVAELYTNDLVVRGEGRTGAALALGAAAALAAAGRQPRAARRDPRGLGVAAGPAGRTCLHRAALLGSARRGAVAGGAGRPVGGDLRDRLAGGRRLPARQPAGRGDRLRAGHVAHRGAGAPALQIAPKVAFALWFGCNSAPKPLFAVLIVFFPVLVTVLAAVRAIGQPQVDLARSFRASRPQIFWMIEFPASMPALFAGLRIGATLAVIGVVVGGFVGGNTGLGHLLTIAQGQANLLYLAVVAIERRVLHHQTRRAVEAG